MMYLALAIAAGIYIYSLFKAFNRWNIQTLQAIVVNYAVAALLGLILNAGEDVPPSFWWQGALMGVFFVLLFNLTAHVARTGGLTTVAIAGKLSLVIPLIFSVFYLKEPLGVPAAAGIVLAIAAVVLVSGGAGAQGGWWPLLLFAGSGTLDILFKLIQDKWVAPEKLALFSTFIFGFAALAGLVWKAALPAERSLPWQGKNVLAGIFLGVVNYFSVVFLLQALGSTGWSSARVFTFHNLGIVAGSTLVAFVLFAEKPNKKRVLGLFVALLSLILLLV